VIGGFRLFGELRRRAATNVAEWRSVSHREKRPLKAEHEIQEPSAKKGVSFTCLGLAPAAIFG
jgi:hypothetical protein